MSLTGSTMRCKTIVTPKTVSIVGTGHSAMKTTKTVLTVRNLIT